MALKTVPVDIPLSGPLDQKMDPKLVSRGSMLLSENTIQNKAGLVQKRGGIQKVSTGYFDGSTFTKITDPRAVFEYNGGLYIQAFDALFSSAGTGLPSGSNYIRNNSTLTEVGTCYDVDVSFLQLASATIASTPTNGVTDCVGRIDAIETDDLILLTFIDKAASAGNLNFVLYDKVNKVVRNKGRIDNRTATKSTFPAIVDDRDKDQTIANKLFYCLSEAGGEIYTYTVGSNSWSSAQTLEINSGASGYECGTAVGAVYDSLPDARQICIVSCGSGSAFYVLGGAVQVGGGSTSWDTITPLGSNPGKPMAISGIMDSSNTIHAAWAAYDTGGATVNVGYGKYTWGRADYTAQTAVTLDSTNNIRWGPIGMALSEDEASVYVVTCKTNFTTTASDRNTRLTQLIYDKIDIATNSNVDANNTIGIGYELIANPWVYEGKLYCPVAYEGTADQRNAFVVDEDGNFVCRIFMGDATPNTSIEDLQPYRYRGLPKVNRSGSRFSFAAIRRGNILMQNTATSSVPIELGLVTVDMDPRRDLKKSELSNLAILPGGLPRYTDGAGVTELGFNRYPDTLSGTASTNGSLDNNANYSGRVVYHRADSRGNIHLSAPSPAATVATGASDDEISWSFPSPAFSTYGPTPDLGLSYFSVFRTEGDGTIHYYDNTSLVASDSGSQAYASVGSTNADSDVLTGLLLYTESGEYENIGPPPAYFISSGGNRLFLVPSTNRNQIWFSKIEEPGRGPEFTDLFIRNVTSGGPIECIGVLDGRVYVFQHDSIRVFYGEGPNSQGAGSFSQDQFLPSDVGCINKNSLVQYPGGLLFQSKRGISKVDRSSNVTFAGSAVQDYGTDTIRSTAIDPVSSRIFFMQDDRTIVYDYYHEDWSTWEGVGGLSCTVVDGKLYFIGHDKSVNIIGDDFRDDDIEFGMKLRTPWVRLGSIAGYQRVREFSLTGDSLNTASLTVRVYQDNNDTTPVETFTLGANEVMDKNSPLAITRHLSKQKCSSIMFEIEEDPKRSRAEGLRLNAISLKVAAKEGFTKLQEGRNN